MEFLYVLMATIAPAVTWGIVRRSVAKPILWAVAGLIVYLALANVLNRYVLPDVWPEPTSSAMAGPVELTHEPVSSFESRMNRSERMTLVAGLIALLLTAGLSWLAKPRARSAALAAGADPGASTTDERASVSQLAGAACGHCGERIVAALSAMHCADCGAPLHNACRADHTC